MPTKLRIRKPGALATFAVALWRENPVLCQSLGVCSALAVTNKIANAAIMGAALTCVAAFSGLFVSGMRNQIPPRIRLIVEMLIIATFVSFFDVLLKAYWHRMSVELGPYVGLIVTNCIVLARAETFAMKNPPLRSMLDGAAVGLGYTVALVAIAAVREPLGLGSLLADTAWEIKIPYDFFKPSLFMALAPGAFLTIGVIVWIFRAFRPEAR